MPRKIEKRDRQSRPPRIRVPNQERAVFSVDNQKFVGILQRLSLTGGSALLVKGPIPKGTLGEMSLRTVYGRVDAHIEFLHTGADGVPLAQAFRFVSMDTASTRRFTAAAAQMQSAGFSDAEEREARSDSISDTWNRLRNSLRQMSEALTAGGGKRSKA